MSLVQRTKDDSIQAMKDKDKAKLSTLRLLISEIEKERVALKLADTSQLTDEQVMAVISRQVKKLEKEKEVYAEAGMSTESQEAEKEVLLAYLPKQLSETEIREIVEQTVADVKAEAGANFGLVMKQLTFELKGKADMKLVSKIAKEEF
jgi:uncharacterized protein